MLSQIITWAGCEVPTKRWSGKKIRKFLAMENLASRIRLQILGQCSQRFLKNNSAVSIVMSLPERVVLMVGIGLHIYGFTIDGVQDRVALCYMYISRLHIRKRCFKLFIHYGYSKDSSTVDIAS